MSMSKILAVDVGNSNAVFAFMEDGKARYIHRVPTQMIQSATETMELCRSLIRQRGAGIEGAVLASVVPAWIPLLTRLLSEFVETPPLLVSPSLSSPIRLRGYDPASLGMDRLTDAAMAKEKYGAPVAVFDLGTCTTLSVVGRDGTFLGGSISAGIQLSLDAEAEHTASLPALKAQPVDELIGKDTASCMLSGAVIGTAALIDGMARKLSTRFSAEANAEGKPSGDAPKGGIASDSPEPLKAGRLPRHPSGADLETLSEVSVAFETSLPVVLTGGLSSLVLPWLSYPVHHEPDLLLEGLALLYRWNRGA